MNTRRIATILGVSLVLGALLTVATSWLCEYRFSGMGLGPAVPLANPAWPMPVDPTWPAEASTPSQGDKLDGPGIEIRSFVAFDSVDSFEMTEVRSGWPLACMRRVTFARWPLTSSMLPMQNRPDNVLYAGVNLLEHPNPAGISIVPDGRAYLPVLPAWGAFAASSAIYAIPLAAIWATMLRLRQWLRTRKGVCVECGYPRGSSPVCTECGRPSARR